MASAFRWRLVLLVTIAVMLLFGACATTVLYQSVVDVQRPTICPIPTNLSHRGEIFPKEGSGCSERVAIDNDGESVWVADRCGRIRMCRPGFAVHV